MPGWSHPWPTCSECPLRYIVQLRSCPKQRVVSGASIPSPANTPKVRSLSTTGLSCGTASGQSSPRSKRLLTYSSMRLSRTRRKLLTQPRYSLTTVTRGCQTGSGNVLFSHECSTDWLPLHHGEDWMPVLNVGRVSGGHPIRPSPSARNDLR